MDARRIQWGERLPTSLWVLPAVCTLLAGLPATAVIAFDEQLGTSNRHLPWTFQGGANSARTVLSTIAGLMITVAGTIYSLTIVVRLLDMLGQVAAGTGNPEYRAALREYVDRIAASAARSIGDPDELPVVQEHAATARAGCGGTGGPRPYPQKVEADQASWR